VLQGAHKLQSWKLILFDITALKKSDLHILLDADWNVINFLHYCRFNIVNVLSAATSVATKRDFQKEHPDTKPAWPYACQND